MQAHHGHAAFVAAISIVASTRQRHAVGQPRHSQLLSTSGREKMVSCTDLYPHSGHQDWEDSTTGVGVRTARRRQGTSDGGPFEASGGRLRDVLEQNPAGQAPIGLYGQACRVLRWLPRHWRC
jgi:hypothetical protein